MNLIRFIEPEGFGVWVAATAAVVAVTRFLLKKINGVPDFVANFLPPLVAAAGAILGELVSTGAVVFSEELFYTAVISYSFGSVLYVTAKKILSGEKPDDIFLTLVEGLCEDICDKSGKSELIKIARLIETCAVADFPSVKEDVISVLLSIAKDGVTQAEITFVAETILLSAEKIREPL